jgi:hypothetical protein
MPNFSPTPKIGRRSRFLVWFITSVSYSYLQVCIVDDTVYSSYDEVMPIPLVTHSTFHCEFCNSTHRNTAFYRECIWP